MASPKFRVRGTLAASPCSSRDVDILSETILVRPAKDISTAFFDVEYTIKCDRDGMQIPLLFVAWQYKDDFKVWVDSAAVELLAVPQELHHIRSSPFEEFSKSFTRGDSSKSDEISLAYHQHWNVDTAVSINSFKYFNVNLARGIHKIRVKYNVTRCINRSGYTNEYSFRYSLSPAKFWRSFGQLTITLDTSLCKAPFKTSLGDPVFGKWGVWEFTDLPAACFSFSYIEPLPPAAEFIAHYNEWLCLCFGLLLLVANIRAIGIYRRKGDSDYPLNMAFCFVAIPALLTMVWFYYIGLSEFFIIIPICCLLPAFDLAIHTLGVARIYWKIPFTLLCCSVISSLAVVASGFGFDAIIQHLAGQPIAVMPYAFLGFFIIPVIAVPYFLLLIAANYAYSKR